ncbi:hypothetical protein GGI21_004047, partial [Coemansia aciculifera]
YPPYSEKQQPGPGAPAGPVYQPQPQPVPQYPAQGAAPPYNPSATVDYSASRGLLPGQPQQQVYYVPPPQQQYYAQPHPYPPQPGVQYVYVPQQDPYRSNMAAGSALGCISAMLA